MRLVDTNILLYVLSTAAGEEEKARIAREVLDNDDLGLSVQVLQEFYVQVTRQSRDDRLSHEQASALVEAFLRFPVQESSVALVQAAMATGRRYTISYWDAAIIEAARMLGCDTVLSEDLGDGQDYGGVTVLNPFRPSG